MIGYPYIFYSLFWWLLIFVVIIVVAVLLVRRFRRQHITAENRVFQIAFSREDALSQLYFLLGMCFLGVSLLAVNRQLGEPFSWQTILYLVSMAGIIVGYRFKVLFTLAFSILGFVGWWVAQASAWAAEFNTKYSPVLAGMIMLSLIMYVIGHFHEQNPKWKRFSFIYIVFAVIFFSGILFFLSTQYGLQSFNQMLAGGSILASWQIMLMLIAFMAALVIFFILTVRRNLMFAPENLAIVLLTVFSLVILAVPGRTFFIDSYGSYYSYYSDRSNLNSLGMFWAVLFNVGVFLEMLGIILVGYLRKESWHVTLGVVLLFILILVKYFDWFFTFLDKSLFFIGAGVLMFGVGYLMERARKKVLQSILPPPPKPNA